MSGYEEASKLVLLAAHDTQMVMNMSLFVAPWPPDLQFPHRDAVFPEQHGRRKEICAPDTISLKKKRPDWMDPARQSALFAMKRGFCQASATYGFPGCGIPFPVLELVLYTHPSCPDVCGGRRLPVDHDVIAQPGGAYVQQSPV